MACLLAPSYVQVITSKPRENGEIHRLTYKHGPNTQKKFYMEHLLFKQVKMNSSDDKKWQIKHEKKIKILGEIEAKNKLAR